MVGYCDTTMTPRTKMCFCDGGYPENMGVCLTFEEGFGGNCAYCAHTNVCHIKALEAKLQAAQERERQLVGALEDSVVSLRAIANHSVQSYMSADAKEQKDKIMQVLQHHEEGQHDSGVGENE